jgi:hypothetical protein
METQETTKVKKTSRSKAIWELGFNVLAFLLLFFVLFSRIPIDLSIPVFGLPLNKRMVYTLCIFAFFEGIKVNFSKSSARQEQIDTIREAINPWYWLWTAMFKVLFAIPVGIIYLPFKLASLFLRILRP